MDLLIKLHMSLSLSSKKNVKSEAQILQCIGESVVH